MIFTATTSTTYCCCITDFTSIYLAISSFMASRSSTRDFFYPARPFHHCGTFFMGCMVLVQRVYTYVYYCTLVWFCAECCRSKWETGRIWWEGVFFANTKPSSGCYLLPAETFCKLLPCGHERHNCVTKQRSRAGVWTCS